ncbi:MAG: MarR family transcriptional regulator [Dehalococcoidia bacterium]|nr:MarR family transcriptional regulator [Dehalococcoidia bacterium]
MIIDTHKAELIGDITELEGKVYRALRPIVPKEWLSLDLTMPQLKIELLLFTDGPARIGTLASGLGVSLATMTGIVDRLVHHGLLLRSDDPVDIRAVLCQKSDNGRELMARLWEQGQSQVTRILERMTQENLELIRSAMEVILQTVSTIQEDVASQ